MIIKPKYYGPRIPSTYAVNMTAAASGSNGITVADDDDIDFGTGDFFLHWEGSLPDWTPSGAQTLIRKNTTGEDGVLLFVDSSVSGTLALRLRDGGVSDTKYSSSIAAGVSDNDAAKITAVVVRESASVAGSVTFYVNGTQLGSSVAITAGVPFSISNARPLYAGGSSTERTASNTISCIVGNFAPAAAEVLDLCTNGIPESWKWGSQNAVSGNVLNGTSSRAFNAFTSGPDGFYGTVPEGSGTARLGCFGVTVVTGDRYRLRATYSKNRTGSVLTAAIVTSRSALTAASNLVTFSDISGSIDAVLTATASGAYFIGLYQNGAGSPGDMELTVTSMTVQKLGATFAALPETIPTSGALAWTDSSGNTGGGTLPAAGATKVTIRK